MIKEFKIRLKKEIKFVSDLLYTKEFVEKDGRKFFFDEEFSTGNSDLINSAMEMIPDGDGYNLRPVMVAVLNGEDGIDVIEKVTEIEECNKTHWYLYFRDLLRNFNEFVSEYAEYEGKSLMGVLLGIIEEQPRDTFYLGEDEYFEYSVLDFKFKGGAVIGYGGGLVLTDTQLINTVNDKVIATLPDAPLGVWVEEDTDISGFFESSKDVVVETLIGAIRDCIK